MAKKFTKKEKIAKVLAYLRGNRLMTLGTSWNNKPWAATVFFAYDNNLNIFFYSRKDTRHCQHIRKNPRVSMVINNNGGEKIGFIKGLQIAGRVTKIPQKDYKRLYSIYKSRFKWADKFVSDHTLYSVRPQEVWYIDQEFFGHFFRVRVI